MNKQAYEHMVGLALEKKAFWGALARGGANLLSKGLKGVGKGTGWLANKGFDTMKFKTPATLRIGTKGAVGRVGAARQGMNEARQAALQSAQQLRQARSAMRNMGGQGGRWSATQQAQANYNAAKGAYGQATTAYNKARAGLTGNVQMNKTIAAIPNTLRAGAVAGGGYYMGKGMGLWGNSNPQNNTGYPQGSVQWHMTQPDRPNYQGMNMAQMAYQQVQNAQGPAWYDVPGQIYNWWAN